MAFPFRDRATVTRIAILQIIANFDLEPGLDPEEPHFRLNEYLRSEYHDIERQIVDEIAGRS
jgi:hypothetical protein